MLVAKTPAGTGNETFDSVLVTLLRKSFLENWEPSTIFMQLWEEPVAQNWYKSVTRPRLNPMKTSLAWATLTEWVVPWGHNNTVSTVVATPALLGDYTKISDVLEMETLLTVIKSQGKELYNNAKRIIDEYIQNTLESDNTVPVIRAWGRATRADLTSADVMDFELVLNWVTFLTSQGETNERFKIIMHPNVFRDFCSSSSTNTWINKVIYDNYKGIQDGYVTSVENFDVYVSANVQGIEVTWDDDTFIVYPTYCLRKWAYGTSSLSSLQTYYKGYGSAGTDDPLNQIATIWWKCYFGCAVLNPFFLVRLESRATTDYAWQQTIA